MIKTQVYKKYMLLALLSGFLLLGCQRTRVQYEWSQSYIGGGGYIIGLMQHPEKADIIYARCDVAGMFRSVDGGETWQALNNGMTECHHHSVESFAISSHDPDIMFRCSGEGRGHQLFGHIHKSVDGGESWYEVTDLADYVGNGNNRMLGEKIQVDPFDPAFVIAGSFTRGVFISHDTGENWEYSGLKGEPIGFVSIHPETPNRIYVGTLGHLYYKDYIFPNGGYEDSGMGRLYLSTDQGKTWNMIFESESIQFADMAFVPGEPEMLLIADRRSGPYKSTDGGKSFDKIQTGLPESNARCETITVDPNRPNVVYTAPSRRGEHGNIPLVPLYKSDDYGETWHRLSEYTEDDFTEYPTYIQTRQWVGWAISKILVDHQNSDKLYMSNWYGVSISEDAGKTWSGHYYAGTETVCCENVVADPNQPGQAFFVLPDHRPFISTDYGQSYTMMHDKSQYNNSTAFVSSMHQKGVWLYGGKASWNGLDGACIFRTMDGGQTFDESLVPDDGVTVQALREDPHTPGTFYALLDGPVDAGAGLYASRDWGETWEPLALDLPEYIKTLPHQKTWIEQDLLTIVFTQTKNVVGTNQLLAVDPHYENTLYVGEWTEGIFKTSDGGSTWSNIGAGLPFKKDTASVLVDIDLDPQRPDVIYAGFIREGLWRSEDGGAHWDKVFPADDSILNASSVVAGGKTPDEIYVACEPLWWSKSPSAIFFSADRGETWQEISDPALGAIRWKGVAVDESTGTVYGVAAGNGAYYGRRK